jgi:hypothetical protein
MVIAYVGSYYHGSMVKKKGRRFSFISSFFWGFFVRSSVLYVGLSVVVVV